MIKYKYKEINAKGKTVVGKQDANSKNEVIDMIKAKGGTPIFVEEDIKTLGEVSINVGSKKVSAKDLSIFSKQMYTMLNAGMPLLSCVESLREQSQSKILKQALGDIYQDLQKGEIFSTTIEKHKNVFPNLFVSMIKSGEISGTIDKVFNNLSIHYQKDAKIQAQIRGAMVYPIILLGASLLVTVLLIVKLVPMFEGMFSGRDSLPGITRFVLFLSDVLIQKWYVIIAVIVASIVLFTYYSKTKTGRYNIDATKLRLPIISKYIKTIISSRFTSTLSVLISSGIPIMKAIEAATDTSNNVIIKDNMNLVIENIKKGSPLSSELKKINIFSPMMISMVKIGEDSGAIDTMLSKTTEFYDEELEEAFKKMSAMMEPAMIIILGGIVAVILLSIYLPIFELSTSGGIK